MKVILALFTFSFIIYSCSRSETKTEQSENYNDTTSVNLKDNLNEIVEKEIIAPEGSKVKIDNKDYLISTTDRKDVGEKILVQKKEGGKILKIDDFGSFFYKLIGDKLIIDNGSSISRSCIVYDLNKLIKVYEFNYEDDLQIQGEKILFKQLIDEKKIPIKPECSDELKNLGDQISYVENLIFDVEKLKITKTGNYGCWYVQ